MGFVSDILNFLYPAQCDVCGRILLDGEKIMCLNCYVNLPRTFFHKEEDNPVARLFWGRILIFQASAWFFFQKGSIYQKLIHKLKYDNRKDIGFELGKFYGYELRESPFAGEDLIIPVPLHPVKKKIRGYNQSEVIGAGLSAAMNIPMQVDNLIRTEATETQTRKNRFDRFQNMAGKFRVVNPEEIRGKKILLIDDVVTTGSTLEACGEKIRNAGCSHLSILTLAVA